MIFHIFHQKKLVELFKVNEGYITKFLRKFEDLKSITRQEDPDNRRQKIVEITDKDIEKICETYRNDRTLGNKSHIKNE